VAAILRIVARSNPSVRNSRLAAFKNLTAPRRTLPTRLAFGFDRQITDHRQAIIAVRPERIHGTEPQTSEPQAEGISSSTQASHHAGTAATGNGRAIRKPCISSTPSAAI
jgi:hypothetical protein